MATDPKCTKRNFLLASFAYSEHMDESYNVKTGFPKLDLKMPFGDQNVMARTSTLYYVNLATGYIPEIDFSIANWYSDESIPYVESALIRMKKFNTATMMRQVHVIRGKMSSVSESRYFPKGDKIPVSGPLDVRQLNSLYADRTSNAFMLKPYLVTLELVFNDDWKKLDTKKQEALLVALDAHADNMFPGVVSTVLVETNLSNTPYTLCIYADHYTDVEAFAGTIRTLSIAPYLTDMSKLLICNHTECAVIENPKTMVSRSN